MAKVRGVPPTTAPARLGTMLSFRYTADGRVFAQKWPRKRPNAEDNPVTAAQVARWDMAQEWVKAPLASEYQIASDRTLNTAFYVRDLLISSMYGNSISWPGWGWKEEALATIQGLLDSITTVPGSILLRTESTWVGLEPGTPGDVLTTHGAGVDPTWDAVTAPAAQGGLYSGLMSPTPTQASTGFGSWQHQPTGATATDTAAGLIVACGAQASVHSMAVLKATAPGGVYIRDCLLAHRAAAIPYSSPVLGFTDGTKGLLFFAQKGSGVYVGQFANFASATPTLVFSEFNVIYPADLTWVRLQDTGTVVSFGLSVDGENYRTVYSETKAGGYLANYNSLVFGTDAYSQAAGTTLMSFG